MKRTKDRRKFAPIFGLVYVVGMLLIEPALERNPPLMLLSDIENSKPYLIICPMGELVYFFPSIGEISVALSGLLGLLFVFLSSVFALSFFKNQRVSRLGIYFMVISLVIFLWEFLSRNVFYLGLIQLRYIAMSLYGLGLFLLVQDRKFLGIMVILSASWDISSAIFWASLKKDLFARLPVPYWGKLSEEVVGAPAILPIVIDSFLFLFGFWIIYSKFLDRYLVKFWKTKEVDT